MYKARYKKSDFAKATVFYALIAVSQNAYAERVYKLNNDGTVTYSDRMPVKNLNSSHDVLNRQGVLLREVKNLEGRQLQQTADREAQRTLIRDRTLLAMYLSEEDLIETRDYRLGLIDELTGLLGDRIKSLNERQQILNRQILNQERARGEGKAQRKLYDERKSIQRSIDRAQALIDTKTIERTETAQKYETDLTRYRELKNR